ncbi:hypothetical protein WJX72_009049 [[Myrmecia] bisecta]|uniref:NEDD8 ultimate buster 1 n=1 Tax=[Myrmecia] bisecta TaxID=41462 RepID=A0AAW1Q7Z5_9CHLO
MPLQIRLAGAVIGSVEVPDLSTTVGYLRGLVQDKIGPSASPPKLIAGGRNLQDDAASLATSRVTSQTRVLVMLGSGSSTVQNLLKEEERRQRLDRLKLAAEAMSSRVLEEGRDAFDMRLENQDGTALRFDNKDDERALLMGMTLHERATKTLAKEQYKDALDELLLAEEAFALCNPIHIEGVDNVALLLIDIVWCHFQLRQIERLNQGKERLARARQALARSHGLNLERLRVLHGNFCPALATYVRLELLGGLAAYHEGNRGAAHTHLAAALDRWQRLQVSDESLAGLLAMGFSSSEAVRALRFCQGDENQAAEFIVNQRQKATERKAQDTRRRQLVREQRSFGRTATGALVNAEALTQLQALGYERVLAAEALRQADNDMQPALDALLDPAQAEALQLTVVRGMQGKKRRLGQAASADVSRLTAMGFLAAHSRAALEHCEGHVDRAAEHLLGLGTVPVNAGESSAAGLSGSDMPPEAPDHPEEGEPLDSHRDVEMEEDLAAAVSNDPLSAYDICVAEEGRCIREYLALLQADNAA